MVKKQNTLFSSIFSGGYIVVTTRSKREFWFHQLENRDGLYDVIMDRIRSVEFPQVLEVPRDSPAYGGDMAVERLQKLVLTPEEPKSMEDERKRLGVLDVPLRHLFPAMRKDQRSFDGYFEPDSFQSRLEIPWVTYLKNQFYSSFSNLTDSSKSTFINLGGLFLSSWTRLLHDQRSGSSTIVCRQYP
jgi:hypothetical protein